MSKRIVLAVGLLMSLLMVSPSLVAAQSTPSTQDEPNVKAIGRAVEKADPATLIEGLQTPPRATALPDGFTKAKYVDISTAEGASSADCMYDASTVNVEGAAGYIMTVDTSVIDYTYTCASINYLAFDPSEMGDDPLGDFKQGVESGLSESDSSGGSGTVTDTTVAGTDAILITYTLKQNGANVIVQTLALPVGNVFVVTLVSVGDTGRVKPAAVEQLANDLAVAAIDHLGAVAEAE